jgi:hypothetical protein
MFKRPEERNPLLHIMERLAGMVWLLATHTIHITHLGSEGRKRRFRADTRFDSAEFEFLMPKHQGCFGILSSNDLQWTTADVKRTRDVIELDALRCYAGMRALEHYIVSIRYLQTEFYLKLEWSESDGYTVLISPAVSDEWHRPWIIVMAPNFEVTAMIPQNA